MNESPTNPILCTAAQFLNSAQVSSTQLPGTCSTTQRASPQPLHRLPPTTAHHVATSSSTNTNRSSLECLVLNADTLSNRMSELLSLLHDNLNPDVILISEVKPKNHRYTMSAVDFKIQGYSSFSANLENQTGRGLIVYVKEEHRASQIELESDFSEHVCIKLPLNGSQQLTVVGVYKSPDSTAQNEEMLFDLIRRTATNSSHVLLAGDFNFPGIDWEAMESVLHHNKNDPFLECIRDTILTQHITCPTRARGGQIPSTLDLVFTNEPTMIEDLNFYSPLGKSDHSCISFKFICEKGKNIQPRKVYFFDRGSYNNMREDLAQHQWPEVSSTNIDAFYNHICTTLLELQDQHIPSKIIKGPRKHKPYQLTEDDLRAIKKKHRCWNRYMESKSQERYREYTRARNKVTKIIRKAQKNLEGQVCDNMERNPKLFWKYVQSKTQIKERIPDLKTTNSVASTDHDKCEVLSEFFASVFTNEPTSEPPTLSLPTTPTQMPAIEVTSDMVCKKLEQLKPGKSSGPDKLHPRILKEVAEEISIPLTSLFQTTLQTGRIPQQWKAATVTAIHKKGDRSCPSNYRPISLTCIPCKIIESIVRDHILDHMNDHNLFSPRQYGFISGRSTTLQLLHVIEKMTKMIEEGDDITVAYFDFQKAFDTVPH